MPSQFTVASPGVTLSTVTAVNVLSQLLAAGSYLIWGQVNLALTAATVTQAQAGISVTSATMPTQAGGGGLGTDALTILPLLLTLLSDTVTLQCGATVLTLASPTTGYLVARATFSVGGVTAYGSLFVSPAMGAGFNMISS